MSVTYIYVTVNDNLAIVIVDVLGSKGESSSVRATSAAAICLVSGDRRLLFRGEAMLWISS